MNKAILTTILVFYGLIAYTQTTKSTANVLLSFSEFKNNTPSLHFDFKMKKRTSFDIFMSGGIGNYRIKFVEPSEETDKLEEEIWGVKAGDSIYINSYPYSKRTGFNLILEKGYYSYFIGEPAWEEKEQRELGIIKPHEKRIPVCCKVGYVILPDGIIKLLSPKLLVDLCRDNNEILKEIQKANLQLENVPEMFEFLRKYNNTKL